jgi:hypothetical protein
MVDISGNPTVVCDDPVAADMARAEQAVRMAASRAPDIAAHGRFQRDVVPAFQRWFAAEIARGELAASTQGLAYGMTNILLSWCGGLAPPGKAVEFAEEMLLMMGGCVAAAERANVGSLIDAAHAEREARKT